MLIDALVSFIAPGSSLSLVAGAGVAIPSPNVIDLLGLGAGVNPLTADIIGNRTVWGTDMGIGDPRVQTEVLVGTALATANAATLNIQFQGAPDAGSPTWQPGAWTTLMETGAIAVANLGAQAIAGRFDFPPAFPVNFSPRFLRLLFVVPAGTNFTAGTVQAPVTTVRDDLAQRYTPKNYAVKGPNG